MCALSTTSFLCLQFQWERYDGEVKQLTRMSREEVVAMLKRQSTGFSRFGSTGSLSCKAVLEYS